MTHRQNIRRLRAIQLPRELGEPECAFRKYSCVNHNHCRIARFLRQSFRQSIRRFRGESVNEQSSPQPPEPNIRGRQSRAKLAPQLNFTASPPDYATVIIETERHSRNSDYGSFNASQDLTSSSLVSSELTLLDSHHLPSRHEPLSTASFGLEGPNQKRYPR